MTYRIKVILLAGGALLLLSTYFLGTLLNPQKDISLRPKPLLPQLETEYIHAVEFSVPEYSLQRASNSAEWQILIEGESFPADGVQVQAFVEAIAGLSYYSVAASDKENWERFSVDTEQGTPLSLTTKGESPAELALVFGAQVPGSGHQYARKSGSDSTYVVDDISAYLGRSSGYWSDLALFPTEISIQDVIAIEYRGYRIERNEAAQGQSRWVRSNGDNLIIDASETVDRFLRNLLELSGEEFALASQRRNSGISASQERIGVETAGGDAYELRIGSKNAQNRIFVRPSHKEFTYLVSEWRVNTILNPLNELLE